MKAWLLILLCIILAYVIYSVDFSFTWNKHLKFKTCKAEYEHTFLTSDDFLICVNAFEKNYAKVKLLRCLCEEYLATKDCRIKEFIMESYNNDKALQENYIRDVVYNVNTTILLKYGETIFRDDKKILDAYRRYKEKDTISLKLILRNHLDDSHYSRDIYNQIIYDMPYIRPTIDTIIKYRDVVFAYPQRYCGGS